jgi:hypothetical protein
MVFLSLLATGAPVSSVGVAEEIAIFLRSAANIGSESALGGRS